MIAQMVERHRLFGSSILAGGAAKMKDAKIVGPRDHTTIIGKKFIVYCVSAVIDTLVGYFPKSAGITIDKLSDGRTHIQVSVPTYSYNECTGPNVEPFPELQRLREKHRRELGKTD